jgi:hypothetical protein
MKKKSNKKKLQALKEVDAWPEPDVTVLVERSRAMWSREEVGL